MVWAGKLRRQSTAVELDISRVTQLFLVQSVEGVNREADEETDADPDDGVNDSKGNVKSRMPSDPWM